MSVSTYQQNFYPSNLLNTLEKGISYLVVNHKYTERYHTLIPREESSKDQKEMLKKHNLKGVRIW